MKARYYLRGLGLGILITSVFFLLGDKSSTTMSDEMIIQRAKELGMVQSTVLADIGENIKETDATDKEEEDALETVTESMEERSEIETVTETMEEPSGTETSVENLEETTEEMTAVETESNAAEESTVVLQEFVVHEDAVTIIVYSGDQCEKISQRLFEAGLIDDPEAYNLYMMQNDYDNRIRGGEHLIPKGAGWEEIANILMRRA